MFLYRYFGSHAEKTIRTGMLKVAKPSEFNDPFEFMYSPGGVYTVEKAKAYIEERLKDVEFRAQLYQAQGFTSDAQFELSWPALEPGILNKLVAEKNQLDADFLKEIPKLADEKARIVCFSGETAPSNEILMWSHYANKHCGVRIAFEIPQRTGVFLIDAVKYQTDRVVVDTSETGGLEFERDLRLSMHTKSSVWSYENEYRMFVEPSKTTHKDGMEFIRFDPNLRIKRIDLGMKYPREEIHDFLKLLKHCCPSAPVYAASIPIHGFQLQYNQIQ